MFILLDIDGVLVPATGWKRPELLHDGFADFKPRSVDLLNKIIHETHASLLLITSHRHGYSDKKWLEIFENRGVQLNSIQKLENESDLITTNRAKEISNWVHSHNNIENYVVIDDDSSLNGLPPNIKKHCVITKPLIGLDDHAADKAIKILRGNY